jgi:hypothetical protein
MRRDRRLLGLAFRLSYDASHLMYGAHNFGDDGSNLVTLKLVADAKKGK